MEYLKYMNVIIVATFISISFLSVICLTLYLLVKLKIWQKEEEHYETNQIHQRTWRESNRVHV